MSRHNELSSEDEADKTTNNDTDSLLDDRGDETNITADDKIASSLRVTARPAVRTQTRIRFLTMKNGALRTTTSVNQQTSM